LTDIRQLLIDTPFFQVPVRLEDVAQVRIVPRPSLIRHENVSRYVDISLDVNGRDAGAIVGDIKNRLRQVQFPLEYHAKVVGAYEQQQSAQNRLLTLVAVALIGILLLLQAAFDSWRPAILSFLTLPVALVGGLVALAVVEPQSVSLGAIFGFLTVFGIAARNKIMLIRRLRQSESNREKLANPEMILFGARERFVPVLMTALTLGLALVPAVLLGDIPGLEILRPTAIVILGGMLTCTFVDLFMVPTLYLRQTR
jgi:Cu/Ag efflux pump CusA